MENINNLSSLENRDFEEKLNLIEVKINNELKKCRNLTEKEKSEGIASDSEDFDKRGELYKLAFDVAPEARKQDLENLFKWINPQKGEISIDVAAGTGMFSIPLAKITEARLYAIDPSAVQLNNLNKKKEKLNIVTIVGSLSEKESIEAMEEDIGNVDIITSYGGIHHILDKEVNGVLINKQHEMFKNASKMLKSGGRFIAGDVGAGTNLAKHFEGSVKEHCLTGHTEKWLSKERFENELLIDTDLSLIKTEELNIKWVFNSERELALFMKGLHAYDMSDEEVLKDLKLYLGYKENNGLIELNWPMFFFHLEKE